MKKFLTCCLLMALVCTCNITAFAAETTGTVKEVSATESTVVPYSTTYLNKSGISSTGYEHFNFTVPSSGNVTLIYACGGNNEVLMVVNNVNNGKTYYSTTIKSSQGSQAKVVNLPAGTYEVYLSGSAGYSYVLNFYR